MKCLVIYKVIDCDKWSKTFNKINLNLIFILLPAILHHIIQSANTCRASNQYTISSLFQTLGDHVIILH